MLAEFRGGPADGKLIDIPSPLPDDYLLPSMNAWNVYDQEIDPHTSVHPDIAVYRLGRFPIRPGVAAYTYVETRSG